MLDGDVISIQATRRRFSSKGLPDLLAKDGWCNGG